MVRSQTIHSLFILNRQTDSTASQRKEDRVGMNRRRRRHRVEASSLRHLELLLTWHFSPAHSEFTVRYKKPDWKSSTSSVRKDVPVAWFCSAERGRGNLGAPLHQIRPHFQLDTESLQVVDESETQTEPNCASCDASQTQHVPVRRHPVTSHRSAAAVHVEFRRPIHHVLPLQQLSDNSH